jgi:hypothetical protein
MTVESVLSLLIGALGAAVLGLIGAWIQSLREHRKWLREQRFEAYRAFMKDMDSLGYLATTTPTLVNAIGLNKRANALLEGYADAFEAVSLLGPKNVNAAGQQWVWAARDLKGTKSGPEYKAWTAARWHFLIAAGVELRSRNVSAIEPSRPGEH